MLQTVKGSMAWSKNYVKFPDWISELDIIVKLIERTEVNPIDAPWFDMYNLGFTIDEAIMKAYHRNPKAA
jgi:hypothetical protein